MGSFHKNSVTILYITFQMLQQTFSVRLIDYFQVRICPLCSLCHISAQFTCTDKNIDITFSGMLSYLLMKLNFILSKFTHIAKDCYSASCTILQNIQRGFHGHGICIIAVIYDQKFICFDHSETTADRLQALDSGFNLLSCKSINISNCSCCQRIIYHMAPRHRDINCKCSIPQMNGAGHSL